jgi:hypothetical protein
MNEGGTMPTDASWTTVLFCGVGVGAVMAKADPADELRSKVTRVEVLRHISAEKSHIRYTIYVRVFISSRVLRCSSSSPVVAQMRR